MEKKRTKEYEQTKKYSTRHTDGLCDCMDDSDLLLFCTAGCGIFGDQWKCQLSDRGMF